MFIQYLTCTKLFRMYTVQYLKGNLKALSRICLVVHPPNGTVRLPYLHRSSLIKGRD
jgi:hypothetical protein